MIPSVKNIIIVVVIVVALIFGYIFFIKKPATVPNLVSTDPTASNTNASSNAISITDAQDFLAVLLNVRSIVLDDSIFSDPTFATLRDSNIVLIQDGTEGRPNPFAPIGFELAPAPASPPAINITKPVN